MSQEEQGRTPDPIEDIQTERATQYSEPVSKSEHPTRSKRASIGILLIVCIVAAILAVTQIANVVGKQRLADHLMEETWSKIESNNGSYYYLYLSFGKKSIDYSGDFGLYYRDYPLATIDYEVTSPTTIEVYGQTVKVEFKDDDQVTFSPSFTDEASFSIWYTEDWYSRL